MERELKGWLQSSQSPDQVANKVRGAILAFSSIIILVAAQFFHIQLNAGDVVSLASEASIAVGAIWTIYGVVLHIVTALGSVKKSTV